MAALPGDFGVEEVGEEGGDAGRDEGGKPKKIVVINNEEGEDGVNAVVKKGEKKADGDVFEFAI